MANKSRFVISESRIRTFFNDIDQKVYNEQQLERILEKNRILWNLPFSMNVNRFIEKLVNSEILIKQEFIFDVSYGKKERFIVPNASIFEVAVSLINKSYLSHFTAVYIHGLTNQIPKTVYISFEQSKKRNIVRKINQTNIDFAFLKPQRKSIATVIYQGYTLLIHNGMYSNRSGVYVLGALPIANIERTLIDITVRPSYAGGVDSVLEVYRKAIDHISINKLIAILDKLDFIYPYFQAVGFYLEKAGVDSKRLEVLSERKMHFNFYLTYEMQNKDFNQKWKIYYPKGMK